MPKLDDALFGPNLWLFQEMHESYLREPESVSEAWREFFEDYYPHAQHARPPSPQVPEPPPELDVPDPDTAPLRMEVEPGSPLSRTQSVLAKRMEESLEVPTATSVRAVPAKLLEVNRTVLNNHQARSRSKKVSLTHILAWAIVRALSMYPGMNTSYALKNGKPHAIQHEHVNLGLAVDVQRRDGTRTLLVPNIKSAEELTFSEFLASYEEMVRKTNEGKLSPDDFSSTTHTITNPGMIGTSMSVPRLMADQSAIFGVGAIDYPAEYKAADRRTLADIGVGKVVTITSTYDHRVIQGALSGEFLAGVQRLMMGEEYFYEEIFASMGVPYVPTLWRIDSNPSRDARSAADKQAKVLQLINIYRVRGHLIADLDPLDTNPPSMHPELDPASYGFTIWDLDRRFTTGGFSLSNKKRGRRAGDIGRPERLGDILAVLRDAYCGTVGIEYMHISEPEEKAWIQQRVEGVDPELPPFDRDRIMSKLNSAEAFETFLHTKYVGHKRFSLEGALSLIPMLDAVLDASTRGGIEEAVIGMAHRGRLNALANIVGKSHREIFKQFEGDIDPKTVHGSGDVKYHLGAKGRYESPDGVLMDVSVVSNPSHLESVDPVVEGVVRAKQDRIDRPLSYSVLPVLVHGDAAFSGQGVVAETLNLSLLRGYRTGGTVHIVVNNQVGFTATARQTRSSTYASDVAKMIQAPVFHVNGDDPEACVRVSRLAFAYRQAFHKDVVIDMWCYRRWGHNEADEPAFTQPLMYRRIGMRRSVRKLYTESLVYRGHLSIEEAEEKLEDYRVQLQAAFDGVRKAEQEPYKPLLHPPEKLPTTPADEVDLPRLRKVLQTSTELPEGFAAHPKLVKWLAERRKALDRNSIDWALGEALALGVLIGDGTSVRLTGQDSRRGTFSQRHAVLIDQNNGEEYTPLDQIDGGKFYVHDSMLSEFAVLGFEYGYSTAAPNCLTIWEAQFGDFANGAQVMIDQFILVGEDKWNQSSSLVMLLPHGFEGQGPEHSSARIERFLTLAAEDNSRIVMPTTAGQFFNILLDQGRKSVRKPLVVFTPKSILRLPAAASRAEDLVGRHFEPVLPDPADPEPGSVRRLLLCSGKVYYDLEAERSKRNLKNLALVRVEQFYPFPAELLGEQLERYDQAEVCWVQEEPENMGPWRYMHEKFSQHLKIPLMRFSRPESASPATGSTSSHVTEQNLLLDRALSGLD
ncbi:MAG: multifunctional oxoglutarate decarboxylase/oxoglutarate dehydrogenase thiamine pyrophosphate-binding subunit/dihydrolipoyllysine-residue succinyltransferase subunit [Actinobacteria bacterium]|nr:multifunctional oxoglutarate decarboxylase/oxoglutarate dehydrogenase thiamine pyrophosphate-binding subunit/dihydrolipoyllysine-residue succinyltransferase subunit [Actinomycetota bacterium]